MVNLRKQNVASKVDEKRQMAVSSHQSPSELQKPIMPRLHNDLAEDIRRLGSPNYDEQLAAVTTIRQLLSADQGPPIEAVVNLGGVDKLMALIRSTTDNAIQFEAAWALTNIASGKSEFTQAVIAAGGEEVFVELLCSPHRQCYEQAVWAVGNIAGDNIASRNRLLSMDAIAKISNVLTQGGHSIPSDNLHFLRNATWVIANLVRGSPPPEVRFTDQAIDMLLQLIYMEDDELLLDACWGFCYLTDMRCSPEKSPGVVERVDKILFAGLGYRFCDLMLHARVQIRVPALRVVGNILAGDDRQTSAMILGGCVPPITELLSSSYRMIRKEAVWAVSNIMAGNPSQIDSVLNPETFGRILDALMTPDAEIRKEGAYSICNGTAGGTPVQISFMVEHNVLGSLVQVLRDCREETIQSLVLMSLKFIFKAGATIAAESGVTRNEFIELFESTGGASLLEDLVNDEHNVTISQKAYELVTTYFKFDEEPAGQDAPW